MYGLPNAKLLHTMKRSGGVISTMKKDISAGRHSFDIVQVGAPIFFNGLHQRGNLMKYDSPNYKNFLPYVTGEKKGAVAVPGYFISSQVSLRAVVWNPKYVKKDIKTLEDVLDPKYKGKIVMPDILRSATHVNVYIGLRKVIPRSYFEKLAKQDPIFVLSGRAQIRKVMTGEMWINMMGGPGTAYKNVLKGAKFGVLFFPEGTVALGYPFGILAKAPNPNTAKLWIDYLHTRRGHLKYVRAKGFTSSIKNPPDLGPLLTKFAPALGPLAKISKIIPIDWSKIGPKEVAAARAEWREIFYKGKKN
jgi:ABC-type Fe3+ transport system substrate-binding protein